MILISSLAILFLLWVWRKEKQKDIEQAYQTMGFIARCQCGAEVRSHKVSHELACREFNGMGWRSAQVGGVRVLVCPKCVKKAEIESAR